jgi:hypothetical protein
MLSLLAFVFIKLQISIGESITELIKLVTVKAVINFEYFNRIT